MGGDLDAATSGKGYSISTKSHFEKVDNKFQEFIQRTGGSLIQSEAHTRKDLIGGASLDAIKRATLDHIIIWIFPNDDKAEMPVPLKSTVGYGRVRTIMPWYRAQSMSNCWATKTLGRETQEAKQERSRRIIDPEQIPRIPSKLDAIMNTIAQQIITHFHKGKCIKEMGLRCVVEVELRQQGC